MHAVSQINPIAAFLYFVCTAGLAMFSSHPVIYALSLAGALSLQFCLYGTGGRKTHFLCLFLWLAAVIINPLSSHKGATPLLFIGDNPVTLEAILYGAWAGVMLVGCIYWFSCFSKVFTSDRLLYLFGRISPKLALMLSMALRYIPLFGTQVKKVNDTQKALGLYKEDNLPDALRGGLRVGGVMVTWVLENGIITADSMAARGYGAAGRSFFALYRFRKSDAFFLAVTLVLTFIAVLSMTDGALDFHFYPTVSPVDHSLPALAGYVSYGVLAFLPAAAEIKEALKWQYLKSKI